MKNLILRLVKSNFFPIIVIVLFSCILTSFNIFHYPSYFDDEGTYMSRAWSLIFQGKLAPYTYWYDHAPLGWMLIAIWVKLTGGFFTFGDSLNTGRVFMVVLNCLSTVMVYEIIKTLTNKKHLGLLASFFFVASPLSISLHRLIFLDNIEMTGILASWLVLLKKRRLFWYVISGLLFGCATLIKETAPFFLPALMLTLWFETPKRHKLFPIVLWFFISFAVISLYIFYALLSGEFFQSGTFLGGIKPHVSLLWSLLWQGSRKGGFFLSPASEFIYTFKNSWLATDSLFLVVGFFSMIVNLFIGIRKKDFIAVSLFALCYIFYLIRGGIINDQYLIPLLPMLAINIGLFFNALETFFKKISILRFIQLIPTILLFLFAIYFYIHRLTPYIIDETSAQQEAIKWVQNNVPKNQIIAIDDYAFVDLYGNSSSDTYKTIGPQHYWEIDSDPGLDKSVIRNNWINIRYMLVTPKFKKDAELEKLPVIKKTLYNSNIVRTFSNPSFNLNFLIPNQEYGHILIADSNPILIYKLNNPQNIEMTTGWDYFRTHFIQSYGQVSNPIANITTSSNQAEGMLMSVLQSDKANFDGIWLWTKDHMQYRGDDKLLSKTWVKKNNKWQLEDFNTSSYADEDIALSLFLAYQKWGDIGYYISAKYLLDDIWRKEIVQINNHFYITVGTSADIGDGYSISSEVCAPANYRVFSLYDSIHPWQKIIETCYALDKLILNKEQLLGQKLTINKSTGVVTLIKENGSSDQVDLQLTQSILRISTDMLWKQDQQGKDILKNLTKDSTASASFVKNIGMLNVLGLYNNQEAKSYYNKYIDQKFNYQFGFWNNKLNLDEQIIGYEGIGVYSKLLLNSLQSNF